MEYFKYMFDLLKEKGAPHIKIFGGGGGTILPSEIEELQAYGITRIYHPDDGRSMGLQGMINDLIQKCDFPVGINLNGEVNHLKEKNVPSITRVISAAENFPEASLPLSPAHLPIYHRNDCFPKFQIDTSFDPVESRKSSLTFLW